MQIKPVETFDYVVFGATGDLTMRKLLPALYYRFRDKQFSEECRIIGTARSGLSTTTSAPGPRRRSTSTCRSRTGTGRL